MRSPVNSRDVAEREHVPEVADHLAAGADREPPWIEVGRHPAHVTEACGIGNERAREHGRVTIGQAVNLTGASRNTLKQHFRVLVERGTLNQQGSGRGVWYDLR